MMRRTGSGLFRDARGATAIEYGLVAAAVALAILGAVSVLGGNIGGVFGTVSGYLPGNAPEPAPQVQTQPQTETPPRGINRDRDDRVGPARPDNGVNVRPRP